MCDSSSSEQEGGSSEQRVTRPKTRGAVLNYVDEDLEQISEALRDRSKALKKWHAKLKSDYDSKNDKKNKDSDSELKEPRTDEDYSDRDNTKGEEENNQDGPPSVVKRARTRRPKGRSISTIIRMRRTRFRNQLPNFTNPQVFPVSKSHLEYQQLIYRVGDVVKVQVEYDNLPPPKGNGVKMSTSYAQIRGFYRDQFCGKYAALQWLAPTQGREPLINVMDQFDPAYFVQGQIHPDPLELRKLIFVMRIHPSLLQINPHDHRLLITKDGKKEFMDGVSSTISSVDFRS